MKPIKSARIACRLVRAIESGWLQTPGSWCEWVRQVKRLPVYLQKWMWRHLQISMSDDAIEYLRRWGGK